MPSRRRWIIITIVLVLLSSMALPALADAPVLDTPIRARAEFRAMPVRSGIGVPIVRLTDTGMEPEPPDSVTVKIEGLVEQPYADLPGTMIVNGQEILVTTTTILRPAYAQIAQGDHVLVHAIVDGETRIATHVRVYEDSGLDNAIEFRGMITEHPPSPYVGNWTVAGHRVIVTDVRAPGGDEPTLGYYAHVIGSLQFDQTILAETVEVLRPDMVAGQFEFEGTLDVVGEVPGEWTIGGVSAWVSTSTVLNGEMTEGAQAQVTGHQTTAGSLIFDRIIVPDQALEPVTISGLIDEINVEEDGYGYWRIDGQTVQVDEQTFVDESRCRAAVGMWAEVVAIPTGISPYALRIRVERPE